MASSCASRSSACCRSHALSALSRVRSQRKREAARSPPLVSVTKIEYYDTADVKYTLATSVYTADTISVPGLVHLKYNQSWPTETLLRDYNAICVTYVAGYTSAALVPQRIRQAMLMLIGHWFENRESVLIGTISKPIEFGVTALLGVDRMMRF